MAKFVRKKHYLKQMNENVEILKFTSMPYGKVELRSDNILTFRPDIGVFKEYNLQIIKELHEVFVEITDGIPRPHLCDNRYITGILNKEEQAYMNKHFGDFATRTAIITASPIFKVLLNSYNSMFKPKVELKTFNSEDVAVEWLFATSK